MGWWILVLSLLPWVMSLLIGGVARWGLMGWRGCWQDQYGGFLDWHGCRLDPRDGVCVCVFFFLLVVLVVAISCDCGCWWWFFMISLCFFSSW